MEVFLNKEFDFERLAPVKGVLFDLDGTLLQVEMREFIPAYLQSLGGCFADFVGPRKFASVMSATTFALINSDDGDRTNEEAFLQAAERHMGIGREAFAQGLEVFCREGLPGLQSLIQPLPAARRILECCFERGLKVAVATNPVFPRALVDARLEWGGLSDLPFDLVTSYENSRYCKPNRRYFEDVLQELDLAPPQCVMVGNDTEHDLAARDMGIPTFLVDTWMIDRLGGAYLSDYQGGHEQLYQFVSQLG